LRFRHIDAGFFAMDFGHANLHKRATPVRYEGKRLPLADFGMKAVKFEGRSRTTAHHVPEGIPVVYHPNVPATGLHRDRVSALSVAPALLRACSDTSRATTCAPGTSRAGSAPNEWQFVPSPLLHSEEPERVPAPLGRGRDLGSGQSRSSVSSGRVTKIRPSVT
jgi:hypothetical protein